MTTKEFLFSAWNWHPAALTACAAALVAYLAAWSMVGKGEVRSPKSEARQNSEWGRVWFLLLALGIFLLTLVSPLDALADGYLFSAHMLQHLLLLLVVPPLLLLAWPKSSPSGQRENNLARLPALRILSAWLAGVGAMWLWHVPALCDAATGNQAVRSVQIISLLVLGALFWQPILGPQTNHRLPPLAGIFYLFSACIGCTLLGIIITFAPVGICPVYLHPVDWWGILPLIRERWGFTHSVDQQVGGLMMWVPACVIYLCGIIGLLARWYAGAETEFQPSSSAAPSPGNIDPVVQPNTAARQLKEPLTPVPHPPLAKSIKYNA